MFQHNTFRGKCLRFPNSSYIAIKRFNSTNPTVSYLLEQVQKSEAIDHHDIKSIIENAKLDAYEESEKELDSLRQLLKDNTISTQVRNDLLTHTLPHDFSLYFLITKHFQNHHWNNNALVSLLKNNPGRVDESLFLFKKHVTQSNVSPDIYTLLLEKFLLGENFEREEYEISLLNVCRAINIVNKRHELIDDEEMLSKLLDALIELNAVSAVLLVKNKTFTRVLLQKLESSNDEIVCLKILQSKFLDGHLHRLSKDVICKLVGFGQNLARKDESVLLENRKKEAAALSEIQLFFDQQGTTIPTLNAETLADLNGTLLGHIEAEKLDTDKTPESLIVRIKVIETYGMDTDQLQKALEKFHHYQTHEKFGLEIVQFKLIQSFLYKAFETGDKTFLKVAETLMITENVPVKIIQSLILAHSATDIQRSLDVYQEFVGHVSKAPNAETGRSASGTLTESLMLAYLYNNDREFAFLLFDKAKENGLFHDELETATVKKLFKVYGEAYEQDDWEKAKTKLHEHVLATIRSY